MEVQLRRLGPNVKIKVLQPPSDNSTKVWLAGRGTCCQIYTKSKYASRKHFSITFRKNEYYIADLQSANGTYLNDEKLTSEKLLTFGSLISVGVPSHMKDTPDCIVFVFEPCSNSVPEENQKVVSIQAEIPLTSQEDEDIFIIENVNSNKEISSKNIPIIKTEENCEKQINNSFNMGCSKNENEVTVLNTSSSDIILIESPIKNLKRVRTSDPTLEDTKCKIRKFSEEELKPDESKEDNANDFSKVEVQNFQEIDDEDDREAYNALTQVDECGLKTETDLLNYSLTEELIEISDSEEEGSEDWSLRNLEIREGDELDEGEVDDDVIFLESISKPKNTPRNDLSLIKIEDELTETDKKWLGKLFKVKQESSFISDSQESEKLESVDVTEDQSKENEMEIDELRKTLENSTTNEITENQNEEISKEQSLIDTPFTSAEAAFIKEILKDLESSEELTNDKTVENESTDLKTIEQQFNEKTVISEPSDLQSIEQQSNDKTVPDGPSAIVESISADEILKEQNTSHIQSIQEPVSLDLNAENEISKVPPQVQQSLYASSVLRKQKKTSSKKSVRFDLNLKIRYIEAINTVKLTPIEKGTVRFARVIYNICNWNTSWLEECKRISSEKDPPDICDQPLRKIPKKFTSHSDYMSSFVPLMLHYLWNKVKDSWKTCGDTAFRQTVSCDSYTKHDTENLGIFKCTGLVQSVESHRQFIREGHLVMLRLHQIHDAQYTPAAIKYSKKLGYLVFGFIESKTYERYFSQPLHEVLAERCSSTHGDLHLVKLTILAKNRPNFKLDKKKLIQITVVEHILSEIKMFRGICFLPRSPLCNAILNPSKNVFKLVDPPENKEIIFKGSLDKIQKEIVSKLTYAYLSENFFLYSIHGAAGTGKGQVVLALILQLLYGCEQRPKIIYCTHSSVPLDETVEKLKKIRENIETSSRFSMVRVGPVKGIKPEVKEFCLSTLAKKYSTIQSFLDGRVNDGESKILEDYDVICTTTASTAMYKMKWAFEKRLSKTNNRKIVCIFDEAMQSREPESLLPLLLGVTHLFLVGDIFQSEPSFTGERTRALGLDSSLFWRIYINFLKISKQSTWPITLLKTQYRMNPIISKFSSKVIYSNYVKNGDLTVSHKIPHLKSLLVLIDQIQDEVVGVEVGNREEGLVLMLVKAITKITNTISKSINISVITCDAKQNEVLQFLLPKSDFPEVEVNQIQKFQGRESDVVVFPCDGTKILVPQIAVAMTRAKSSLFLLVAEHKVVGNVWLEKMIADARDRKVLATIDPNMTPEEFEKMIKK